ncbi:hypothetical protein LCGC14_0416790 [marine sediment metagenome]|uniref:DUF4355 domain-containing protein n=1 Tax=marine sediment metagenome TaxID=412755 RepID=A0A0F9SS82_9ZZZZ
MDGTEERENSSQGGDSPGEQKGTSETPQTFTKDSEAKAVLDALSTAGRDAKTIKDKTAEAERILTDAKKLSDGTKVEREQWQKDRDEAEREAVRDDHEALKSLTERQRQRNEATKLAKERSELDTEKAKHQESITADKEQIRVFNRTQLAAEIAVSKGVNVDTILNLAKDDSREAMEAVANVLSKTPEKPPLKSDDGTTLGGGASFEQIRDAMIKHPSNDAIMKRYIEAKAERDKNR